MTIVYQNVLHREPDPDGFAYWLAGLDSGKFGRGQMMIGFSESPEYVAQTGTLAPTSNCSSSYPTVCIPPAPPDLDCPQIPHRRFTVLSPDPHGFDADHNGIGCENG